MPDNRIIRGRQGKPPTLRRRKGSGMTGLQIGNNIYKVPPGMSVEPFARSHGLELKPRSRDSKPRPGQPHDDELNIGYADDPASDNNYDELVAETGRTSAVPRLSTPSAVPSLGASAGFKSTTALTPLREATKQVGSSLLGRLEIVRSGNQRFVKTADLERIMETRGSRAKQKQSDSGAAAKVATEISNATAARQKAFAARRAKIDAHQQKQRREYRPRNY